MLNRYVLSFLLSISWVFAFTQEVTLLSLLQGKDTVVDLVLSQPEKFEVQLIYTQIIRDEDQNTRFKNYSIGVDDQQYFYPASTVKLPVAIQALEKINRLGIIGLSKESRMITGATISPQTDRSADSTALDNFPSIAHDIHKIFLYSENDAYNRLFEFLGANRINKDLSKVGIGNTRIVHRVGAPQFDVQSNKLINPVSFFAQDQLLYHQGGASSVFIPEFNLKGEKKGVGYYSSGKLINDAKDFSNKNFISLENLTGVLKRVVFPNSFDRSQRFLLTKKDREFLIKSMGTKPSESYIEELKYPDAYVKFFIFGGQEKEIPEHIRIINKVGDAYGYLIDVAYVVDLKNNIEFILSGVIHVNENQIFNDDNYQYDSIGLPFFKAVGNIIYDFELQRDYNTEPDLSEIKGIFNYSSN